MRESLGDHRLRNREGDEPLRSGTRGNPGVAVQAGKGLARTDPREAACILANAAAAHIGTKKGFDLFTIASSSENPLLFRSLYEHVRDYFHKHPMTDRAGKPVSVPKWRDFALKCCPLRCASH